jgi:Ca2+-binding RTX toxin-like protein
MRTLPRIQSSASLRRKKELSQVGVSGNMTADSECKVPADSPDGCITQSSKRKNFVGSNQKHCVDGKGGNDKIIEYRGNDRLFGWEGKDLADGDIGNDELRVGPDPDISQCGPGTDKSTDLSTARNNIRGPDCE